MKNMKRGLETVFGAWLRGEYAAVGNLRTDGQTIYSYAMPIGRKTSGKTLVVGGKGPSVTTSKHINYIRGQLAICGTNYSEVDASVIK
jgi:hypothetical protein